MNWTTWAFLSAVFAALTAILAKVGVASVDSTVAMAVRTTAVFVLAWLFALPRLAETPLSRLNSRAWLFLVLSGVATGASWFCYFRALKMGRASQVAPVDKLSVVLVLIFAAIFLGERLTMREWIGAGMIAAGVVLMVVKPSNL